MAAECWDGASRLRYQDGLAAALNELLYGDHMTPILAAAWQAFRSFFAETGWRNAPTLSHVSVEQCPDMGNRLRFVARFYGGHERSWQVDGPPPQAPRSAIALELAQLYHQMRLARRAMPPPDMTLPPQAPLSMLQQQIAETFVGGAGGAGGTVIEYYEGGNSAHQAEARAEVLLLEWLSPEQRFEYADRGYFHVTGEHTGARYRLHRRVAYGIAKLDADGKICLAICFGPQGRWSPMGDILLTQKIALENFETVAMRQANALRTSELPSGATFESLYGRTWVRQPFNQGLGGMVLQAPSASREPPGMA